MANDVAPLLGPLLDVLGSGRLLRLVAWPGRVLVDRADGSARVEVAWSAEQHQQATAALSSTITLENGVTASALAGSIILRRPPDPMRRIDDLVGDGRISQLAGRFLAASCGLGRNVLVAGPWGAGVELIAALLSEGQRPALVGRPGDAVPPAWPVVQADELLAFGPDRVGAWSLAAHELVPVLGRASAVIAWIDANRLDRALVRFEAAVEQAFQGATAPLQVLAGIDLVVILGDVGGVRVRQIAEICLAEEGYRPRLLFATDVPPVPTALVPVGAPTFLDDLARGGHHVLADELRHAVPMEQPTAPAASAPAPAPEVASEPQQQRPEPVRVVPVMDVPVAPTLDPALADAPPPGWELDQIDEEVAGEDVATSSPEAAALAASFGLGPPPPPPGVAPISPEVLAEEAGEPPPSFEEAMARARVRDEEMRQDEDEEG